MNIQPLIKKVANNILEFLIDPTVYPPERHIYFRPEEILENSFYENARKDSERAYGDQRQNSDFYPNRPIREASSMERKTLIASLDVLSQEFNESDPIAKDLRTMAYAIANMSDERLKNRLATDVEAKSKVKMIKCPKCGGNVMEKTGYCLHCKKKISEMKTAEEESVETEKVAGKIKGPGIPDGTGPMKDSPECPKSEEKKATEVVDFWTKEATEAIRKNLIAEVSGACGEKKEEKVPEKEAAVSEKKEVEVEEKVPEKKEVEAKKKVPEKEVAIPEEKEVKVEEKVPEKEATKVDTDLLTATSSFDGIELQAGLITTDDVGDLSETEKSRLSQLF